MAYNFSANQFEQQYSAKRLGNWELPKWHASRPRSRRGSSKIIADDVGHLLPNVKRSDKGAWSNYRSTYQLPEKLTRRFGADYNDCLSRRDKWQPQPPKHYKCEDNNNNNKALGVAGKALSPTSATCELTCQTAQRVLSADKEQRLLQANAKANSRNKSLLDLEYIPGDLTPPQHQHDTRRLLLQKKFERDNDIEPPLHLDQLYLGHHAAACGDKKLDAIKDTYTPPLPLTTALNTPLSPPLEALQPYARTNAHTNFDVAALGVELEADTKMQLNITGKPNERCPSPVVPAYANFELARRMHQDNLDHQPLPDCVADAAYRRLQMSGGQAGLALDLDPFATGVGIRTHNAGPTHCTKMKVYRPQTCGVVPKVYDAQHTQGYEGGGYSQRGKKMGAMDLAIGWDYRPSNAIDEPLRPAHIDGSDETAGPAVFNYVKSPRDDALPTGLGGGRSAGVFNSTLGEADFFDKDIMRRKTDFGGANIAQDDGCACGDAGLPSRARSVSRDFLDLGGSGGGCGGDSGPAHLPVRNSSHRLGKQYQSTPDVMSDQAYKTLRDKYLGGPNASCRVQASGEPACRRGFFRRATSRPCHKVAPAAAVDACCHMHETPPLASRCKPAAFRAGLPRYDAGGNLVSTDSGCSAGSNYAHRVLVVPRPKIPYAKRNYDIDTLVPPFRSSAGGAGEGGYPEHWRLASVYQHAYKPPELRRRPLLQTVYK